MNIIMAVISLVGLKRAPECIKMHHFEGENAKIFHGEAVVRAGSFPGRAVDRAEIVRRVDHHHHHHLICKQLKQIITTVQYVKDSRYNQAETAPTVALDTTNTSTTEHQKINNLTR